MPLPALEAHLICVALVATDVVARAWRLQRILRALRYEVPLARLGAITLTCDAACALTPYRAGGDAVRVASLVRAGVSLRRTVLAIACEAVQVWPTVLLCGLGLAWFYGAEWWGAFTLLHSQLVLPLPAGAGAVDLGFLAGAQRGVHVGFLLVSWRLYTSGIGLALGLAAVPMTFRRPATDGRSLPGPAGKQSPRGLDRSRSHGFGPAAPRAVAGEGTAELISVLVVERRAADALTRRGSRSPPAGARA